MLSMNDEVNSLKARLDDCEKLARQDELVISGSVVSEDQSNPTNPSNTAAKVRDVLRTHLSYELPIEKIVIARRLGNRVINQSPDSRKILLKVSDAHILSLIHI